MTSDQLSLLTIYEVTRANSDGSVQVGDLVWLTADGELHNATAGGWMSEDDWLQDSIVDFECILSDCYYLEVLPNGRERIKAR